VYLEYHLKPTWDWLISVMDSTEAQLRFGSVLSSVTSPAHPSHPLHTSFVRGLRAAPGTAGDQFARADQQTLASVENTRRRTTRMNVGNPAGGTAVSDGNSARRDFLTYALSLMRSHNDEHADNLPTLDITSLKHVAYVLDALIYYMRSGGGGSDADSLRDGGANDVASVQSWQDPDDNLNDDADDDAVNQSETVETDSMDGESDVGGGGAGLSRSGGRRHAFFQRSESTMFLGCVPPDPFHTTLVEALPLADQPHLLHPYARKEELFGMPRQTVSAQFLAAQENSAPSARTHQQHWPFDHLPTHMSLSYRTAGTNMVLLGSTSSSAAPLVYPQMSQSADLTTVPPPAHFGPPAANTDTSVGGTEPGVITHSSTRSSAGSAEPKYLGLGGVSGSTCSLTAAAEESYGTEMNEPVAVESIPLPTVSVEQAANSAAAVVTEPLSISDSQHQFYQQQQSVIVHAGTSAIYRTEPLNYGTPMSHPAYGSDSSRSCSSVSHQLYHPDSSHSGSSALSHYHGDPSHSSVNMPAHPLFHSEPLELSVNVPSGELLYAPRDVHPRNPPPYDDLQSSGNVGLDLTNPSRGSSSNNASTSTSRPVTSESAETVR
jgi:hypothetical protein